MDAVRADNPLCFNQPCPYNRAVTEKPRNGGAPQQLHPTLLCALDQFPMENNSPHSDAALARKLRLSKGRPVDKSNVLKALPVSSLNANP
jgi:hypothetical protein